MTMKRGGLLLAGVTVAIVVVVLVLSQGSGKVIAGATDLDRLSAEMQRIEQDLRGEIAGVRILAIVLFVAGLALGAVATLYLLHRVKFCGLRGSDAVAAISSAHKLTAEAKPARGARAKTQAKKKAAGPG